VGTLGLSYPEYRSPIAIKYTPLAGLACAVRFKVMNQSLSSRVIACIQLSIGKAVYGRCF
jgi:hypothetical protein